MESLGQITSIRFDVDLNELKIDFEILDLVFWQRSFAEWSLCIETLAVLKKLTEMALTIKDLTAFRRTFTKMLLKTKKTKPDGLIH